MGIMMKMAKKKKEEERKKNERQERGREMKKKGKIGNHSRASTSQPLRQSMC